MKYRDLLRKRSSRVKNTEKEEIKYLGWPLTYQKARTESYVVLNDEGACDVSKGLATVVIALLDERMVP